MNAIMASLGGRAPPGQNKLTPCEESRSLVEAPGSRAPGPSASRLCRSERQPAYRCRPPPSLPIPEASVPCSRSWLRSKPPLPIATGAHARGPEPAAPRGNGPQAKTCCLSACSWLHFLKCWSLRQTRSGSLPSPAFFLSELVVANPLNCFGAGKRENFISNLQFLHRTIAGKCRNLRSL